MFARLSQLREERAKGDKGFTLIELLVVVVILGILIAIAIPLYLNYRKGANDSSAKSDLRNAVNVLEQCNTDGGNYPTAVSTDGKTVTGCSGVINLSNGTTVTYIANDAKTPTNYIMSATNSNGATKYYCYASAAGGQVKTTTATVAKYADSCPA